MITSVYFSAVTTAASICNNTINYFTAVTMDRSLMLCKTNSEIVSIIYIRYQNDVEYLIFV